MEQKRIGLNIIGANLRRIRKSKKLTQTALIAHCQIMGWQLSRESLAKVETGLRRVNDAEVCLFAKVLRCPIDALMEGSDEYLLDVVRHGPDVS